MKKFYLKTRSILCTVLCLLGISAYAQESITVGEVSVSVVNVQTVNVTDNAEETYAGLTAEFDVQAVVTALGIDSIAQAAEYIVNVTTNEAVENITDGWRNGAGDAAGWGDITEDSRGYCVKISDPASGMVDYLGAHHNGVWNQGETFTALWAFVANEKAALVKVVVTFAEPKEPEPDPDPDVELPEAETDLTKVEVVGRFEGKIERYFSQGYETTDCAYVISDMAEKLGIGAQDLSSAIARMTYVDKFLDGTYAGQLQLLTVTDGWMRHALNEDEEESDQLCAAQYSGDCEVYIQQMAYADSTSTVSFVLGQMPGKMELGQVRYADLYVVYGSKAYVIRQTVNFVAPPYNGIEDMIKVAETEVIKLSQQPTNDYSAISFTLELDSIAAMLGCDPADVQMQGLTEEGGLSIDHTANNGGWWFNAEGVVRGWGEGAAFFIEPTANNVWSEFHIGQFPDAAQGGEEYVAKLYLTYQGKYYEVEVHFTISEKEDIIDPDMLEVVATRSITIEQELNGAYAWSEGVMISNEDLTAAIETTTPHLYAEALDGDDPEDPTTFYTDEYSCDPKPGFWMTKEGKRTTWSSGGDNPSPWGISIANESLADGIVFNCIQFPGLTAVGDTYQGAFYLANEETGKMLQVNVTYNIVSNIVPVELVGEKDIVMMIGDDEFACPNLDMQQIADSLGYESLEEFADAECMRAMNENGVYGNAVQPKNGLLFGQEGYESEEGLVGIYVNEELLSTYDNADIADSTSIKIDICFENEGKRYVFHVTLLSKDLYKEYTAIQGVQNGVATIKWYDLQGRQVKTAAKGILISKDKKVVKF